MLQSLSLQDFVIVDRLELDFAAGFTVLTGETGAGKSIILDAIGLVLGGKADFSQVRTGAAQARIGAVFDIGELPALQEMLAAAGLANEDGDNDVLFIRRLVDAGGKSRGFINHQAVPVAMLKEVGGYLIDIHGQNAHHSLNRETCQRDLLDAFAGAKELAQEVKAAYARYRQAQDGLNHALENQASLSAERERLQWQADELMQLNPQANEWSSLSRLHDGLAHAAQLVEAAAAVENRVSGEQGLQDMLYQCNKILQPLARIEPLFEESLQLLASVEAELGEVAALMRTVGGKTDYDAAELAEREARMAALMAAARKYRVPPESLAEKWQEIEAALVGLAADADIETLRAQLAAAEENYLQLAQKLSQLRNKAAQQLGAEAVVQMQKLAMKGARFEIALLPAKPSAAGLEQVQFLVAANPGVPLRPLNKVASGGELARISLALQVVAGRYMAVPTLIFDEVDSGIGGGVAQVVGKAMRDLGRRHQVLAVTHLPQVAACGQNHWQVSKSAEQGQTLSRIRELDGSARIEEIARMLGGEVVSDLSRHHAAEMLQQAEQV